MVLRRSLFCLLLSSAIDFYCSVERITGASGEPRVLIKFNGKHLPHIDQEQANDTS
jgi:cyanate lyase